ncbi:hypothetical protein AKO1_009308 [Acrasis kona]|uniref:Uncharacterized protein n=1 Tax=Acrasis kona TaxID=1008807 RepID=A0AAW2ZMH0_9EUKA
MLFIHRASYLVEENRFNNEFPDALHSKNIYPNLYEQTMEGCSTIMQIHLRPMKDVKWISILLNILIWLVIILAMIVPGILYAVKVSRDIWLYYIIIGYPAIIALGFISLTTVNVVKSHKLRKGHLSSEQAIINFLQSENHIRYEGHRVKFTIHYDAYNGFGPYSTSIFSKRANPPIIELTDLDATTTTTESPPPNIKSHMPKISVTTNNKPFQHNNTHYREEGGTPINNPFTEAKEQRQPLLNKYQPSF